MTATAQKSLSGSWKETKRSNHAGQSMAFKDTILIDFLVGQEYTWMKAGGFIYRGTYKIENGALDMGSRYFTIVDRNKKRLILKDQGATYEFSPYQAPPRTRLEAEPPPAPVTSLSGLEGKWSVFKRTGAATQKEIDYTTLVKSLMIYEKPDSKGAIGDVSGGKDAKDAPSWYIVRFEKGILYCDGKSSRQFEVIKGDPKELIIKEGDITYFFKQFR